MGEENYTRIGVVPKELYPGDEKKEEDERTDDEVRKIGDVVQHAVFGRGTITGMDPQRRVYEILFENGAARPVSMDYNFGAWNALDAMREEALRMAREAENASVQSLTQPNVAETEIREMTEKTQGGMENGEEDTENTAEVSGTCTLDLAETDMLLPEECMGRCEAETAEKEENGNETDVETAVTDDVQMAFADPGKNENVPQNGEDRAEQQNTDAFGGESKPTEGERKRAAREEQLQREETTKLEMPMRYRNAEWNRAPAEPGETNLWKRNDVPHEGWTCEGVIDLGALVGTCRMCGKQIIRYVHVMRHPEYPRTIGAGCVCAGRMEGDPEAARLRENAFKNRQQDGRRSLHCRVRRAETETNM